MNAYSGNEERELPGDAELVHDFLGDSSIPWGERQARHSCSPRIAKMAQARRERERQFRARSEGKRC